MTFFISLLLLFQTAVLPNDISELRGYLGMGYRGVLQALDEKNQILLRNTQRLAPAQAAEMQARWKAPDRLPTERPILAVGISNVGQGLASFLFEDDFLVHQVNFVFCPAQRPTMVDAVAIPARGEQVMAIQVLFDDSHAVGGTVPQILQNIYRLPASVAPLPLYRPALAYPLTQNLPATFWSFDPIEAVFQPVSNTPKITGQLWLTHKTIVRTCVNLPRIN